ncbi:MAG: hypothetical protein AAGD86_10665, partial [Pseudomonadota bacterium]
MKRSATPTPTHCLTLLAAAALAGCGGGSGSESATGSMAVTVDRTVTGVVSKGPISGATVSLYDIDADGFKTSDVPIAQTVTDAAGNWSVSVADPGDLLVVATGGRYVDEADAQPDPANRRTVELAADAGFEAYLPASASVTPLNAFTAALLRRSRLLNPGDGFATSFADNRAELSAALGFDPVGVAPADPIAPAATASDAERQYAMALGGVAHAVNTRAIALGLDAPDFAVIDAVVDDLTDCALDAAAIDGTVMVQTGGGAVAAVAGQSLNAQILRFRNNNIDAYGNTAIVAVDAAACASVTVTPDALAPVFTTVPGPVTVNAVSAAGTPLTDATIAAALASVAAVDDRPGPVALTNDAPGTLPLGDTAITVFATDVAGNTAETILVITVADLEAPT